MGVRDAASLPALSKGQATPFGNGTPRVVPGAVVHGGGRLDGSGIYDHHRL